MLNLFKNAAVICSIAGLVSACGSNKEEKTFDIFNAPAPELVRHDQTKTVSVTEFTGDSKKVLDLKDAISVANSSPVKMDVRSECRLGGLSFTENFSFFTPQKIAVSAVLPEFVFGADFNKEEVLCSFGIALQNDKGSKRIFNIGLSKLADLNENPVRIQLNGNEHSRSDQELSIGLGQIADVMIRYNNTEAANAKMICRKFKVLEVPFPQVINFSNFDFIKKVLNIGENEDDLKVNPVQTCRIVVTESGKATATSPIFNFVLVMPRAPVEFTIQPGSFPGRADAKAPSHSVPGGRLLGGEGQVTFSEIRIINPDSAERAIRIPKMDIVATAEIFMTRKNVNVVGKVIQDVAWMKLEVFNEGGGTLLEDANFIYVNIPAEKSIVIRTIFKPRTHLNCGNDTTIDQQALRFTIPQEVQIDEINPEREPIGSFKLNLGPPQLFNYGVQDEIVLNQAPHVPLSVFQCTW